MIERWPRPDGRHAQVRFSVSASYGLTSVVGDFNGWDPHATPLQLEGSWQRASIIVETGRRYRFRYVDADGVPCNDETADDYEPNEYGGHSSVLAVPAGTDDARPTTAAQAPEAPSGAAGPVTADQANDVINQIFRAGLVLAAAAQLDDGPSTEKIAPVIDQLDTTIRHVRTAVFEQSASGLDHAVSQALARATDCLRAVEANPVFADIDPGNEPATPTRAGRDVEDRLRGAGQLVETALRQILGHTCLADGRLSVDPHASSSSGP